MRYVLGSEVESMVFTDAGPEYEPTGATHAVDRDADTYTPGALVGYAVCGTAVRLWPEREFDPDAASAHDQCVAMVRGEQPPG